MGFYGLYTYAKTYQVFLGLVIMKKILITGGCGTVGAAFINEYCNQYYFVSLSRNREKQAVLKNKFERVEICISSIEDRQYLIDTFLTVKPDIVVHTAAMKQIHHCENQPSAAINVNIIGSQNVIEASRVANVPITIAISSDKACSPNSVYGYTKSLMEKMFLEANTEKNRFVCCRFGNVAGSDGSVIPFWLTLAHQNKPLQITDPKMNRFMFSPKDCAHLIHKAIDLMNQENMGFVLLKKIKAVNLYDLAQYISSNIEVIGKRAGERLDERLVSVDELPFTGLDGDYVLIKLQKNEIVENRLCEELNSFSAEKMTRYEIESLVIDSTIVRECVA